MVILNWIWDDLGKYWLGESWRDDDVSISSMWTDNYFWQLFGANTECPYTCRTSVPSFPSCFARSGICRWILPTDNLTPWQLGLPNGRSWWSWWLLTCPSSDCESLHVWSLFFCLSSLPSQSLTVRPWKATETPIGKDRLPTTIFRGELLNFGGVILFCGLVMFPKLGCRLFPMLQDWIHRIELCNFHRWHPMFFRWRSLIPLTWRTSSSQQHWDIFRSTSEMDVDVKDYSKKPRRITVVEKQMAQSLHIGL